MTIASVGGNAIVVRATRFEVGGQQLKTIGDAELQNAHSSIEGVNLPSMPSMRLIWNGNLGGEPAHTGQPSCVCRDAELVSLHGSGLMVSCGAAPPPIRRRDEQDCNQITPTAVCSPANSIQWLAHLSFASRHGFSGAAYPRPPGSLPASHWASMRQLGWAQALCCGSEPACMHALWPLLVG